MYYVIILLKDVDKPITFSFSTKADVANFISGAQSSPEVVATITINNEKFVEEVYNK